MAGELDRIRERVRQNRAARRQTNTDTSAVQVRSATGVTGALVAGTRVVDLVTGEEGEVLGGFTENILVPAAQR